MSQATNEMTIRVVHLTSAHSGFDVRIFHKECRSLARAGYEVVEIGNFEFNGTVDNVAIRGLNRRGGRLQRSTVSLVFIAREAMRAAGDLYHLHDPELLLVGLLLRAVGKRVIYDIHEDLPRDVLFKPYVPKHLRKPLMWIVEQVENAAAQTMSGLVTATPAIANRFYAMHSNTIVVNNYALLDEYPPAAGSEWKNRDLSVAFIGGISEERGIREMLAAMDLLPRTLGAKLELAGWFYVKELKTHLAASSSWQHVHWRGRLDRMGTASLLERVRAGLIVSHPQKSHEVSQPNKLFEYMAAGVPVIASDFPLWRKIIEDAGCGLLVDPFDTRAIATAIEYLITNLTEAEAMGRRGRQAVQERFSWSSEEQVLLSFYSSLLPQSSAVETNSAAY
ncbi:MAG TPA: glycosyltransferase family 4 protein [Acidobacteriaceae bacterium]